MIIFATLLEAYELISSRCGLLPMFAEIRRRPASD